MESEGEDIKATFEAGITWCYGVDVLCLLSCLQLTVLIKNSKTLLYNIIVISIILNSNFEFDIWILWHILTNYSLSEGKEDSSRKVRCATFETISILYDYLFLSWEMVNMKYVLFDHVIPLPSTHIDIQFSLLEHD